MTTPSRAFTLLGLTSPLIVAAVLLGGATRVPAPEVGALLSLPFATRAPAVPSLQAAAESSLPAPRIIRDPDQSIIVTFDGQGRTGVLLTAPAGRWFPLAIGGSPDEGLGRTGRILTEPRVGGGQVIAWPPPADSELQRLTQVPTILNSDAIRAAVVEEYPAELRARGLGGTVGVQFLLDRAGDIEHVRIGQVSMYPELDRAALRVAEVYEFMPAVADGETVPIWVVHAVDFRGP